MIKPFYLLLIALSCAGGAGAQSVLTGGYAGMAAINGTTLTTTATVPRNGSFIAASRDGAKFFAVAVSGTPRIYIISASSFAVLDSIPMPAAVGDISATAEADRLFAIGDRALYRVNTASKTVVDSVVLSPVAFSFSRLKERPGSSEVWVSRDSMLYVVNYSSGLTAASFKLASGTTVNGPMAFTAGGSVAYKWGQGTVQKLLRIDAVTHAVTTVSGSGGFPAVNADSSAVWAPGSSRMYLYNPATLAATDSFAVQPAPNSLYRHPTRNEMWGIGHLSDTLTVFNASTKAVLAQIRLTADPFFLAFATGGGAPSAIAPSRPEAALLLFPNPAAEVLTVQLPEAQPVQLTVCDLSGRIVAHRETATGWAQLPVAALSAGTYLLSVTAANGAVLGTQRWIKN